MSAITAVSGYPHGPHVLIVAGLLSFLVRALPRLLCLAGARVSLAAPTGQSMRHSAYLDAWIPLSPDRGNWGQEVSAHMASHPGGYDRVIVTEESLIEAFARSPLTALQQRRWREFVDWIPFTPAASWATLPWSDLPFLFRQLTKFSQRSSNP